MPSFVKNDDELGDFNIETLNLSFLNESSITVTQGIYNYISCYLRCYSL